MSRIVKHSFRLVWGWALLHLLGRIDTSLYSFVLIASRYIVSDLVHLDGRRIRMLDNFNVHMFTKLHLIYNYFEHLVCDTSIFNFVQVLTGSSYL